jgi:hypothetical protein
LVVARKTAPTAHHMRLLINFVGCHTTVTAYSGVLGIVSR